jgi:hypothetical protein
MDFHILLIKNFYKYFSPPPPPQLAVLSRWDPGLHQDQFPGVSTLSYFSPVSNIHFLQIICNVVESSLSWLSNRCCFLSGVPLNTFFTVQMPHTPFAFTAPNILPNIFLSYVAKLFSPPLLKVQTS